MNHVANYFEFLYEGKKLHTYTLRIKPSFNVFNLLQDLRPLGAEVLENKPNGKTKNELIVTIALDKPNKDAVETVISKSAEILSSN